MKQSLKTILITIITILLTSAMTISAGLIMYPEQGGTGTGTLPSDGSLLIGSGTDQRYNVTTLTEGSNITITNASGTITIGGSGGSNWEQLTVNAITPTSSIGIIVNASSTFTATTTIENDFVVNQGGIDINLPADDNITIDGRTNPRTVTVGAMRWNHTPDANTLNTRALFLDIDANSVPNTQGMHINLMGTLIAAGETVIGLDIVGDTADSTGGVIRLIELDKTGIGSAEVHGIHIEPEIAEVIHHASGTFIDPTQGWDENGGFTSTTHAFSSSTLNVTIFNADDDVIYIGADAEFQDVEVIMNTGASNPGIKPTFAISTAGAYTAITPIDNTAGFRESGIIDLEDVDLSSWAATSTNSVSKFYLQITRTQNNLVTDPIETLIQTAAVTDYIWDLDGRLNISSIVSASSTLGVVTSGTWNGDTIDISSYTNLAAGRSLTMSGDSVEADSELYSDGDCKYIEDPTADDDLESLWSYPMDITITRIKCDSDQTIDFDLQDDDGSPADIMGTDLQCAAGENSTTTGFADASIAANDEIDLITTSVSGTPTWVSICIFFTYND